MRLRRIWYLLLAGFASLLAVVAALLEWRFGRASGLIPMAVLLLLVVAIQLWVLRRLELHSAAQEEDYRQIESLVSLFAAIDFRNPLPRMRGWAISPDFAGILVSLIRERKPKCIVEAGSGVSTLIAAYCLQKLGDGQVISLEHDAEFARSTTDCLSRHGLRETARVVHAPLKNLQIDGREYIWYDSSSIVFRDKIDLLVIDGPPEFLHDMARYPALPVLHDRLAEEAVIVLDDAKDDCNRRILDNWMRTYRGFQQEWIETEKGTVILTRQRAQGSNGESSALK